MVVRIVLFLLGLGALGAGGYLGWLHQDQIPQLSAFDPANPPWMLMAAAGAGLLGFILFISGFLVRTESKESRAAEAARRAEAIRAADYYYSERARAADRDWRSGDLPEQSPPAAPPAASAAPSAPPAPPAPAPAAAAPAVPFPAPVPQKPIPATQGELQPAPAPSAPPPKSNGASAPAPAAAPASAPAPAAARAADPALLFPEIRKALADKRLDDADRLLNEQRARFQNAGDADGLELAELTSLAGEHAAASGRLGGAKWLWRLALQRYGAANALNSPSARAVSERLRLADQ